jgi:hypothetical protein
MVEDAHPRQLAYEIEALGVTAVMQSRLLSDAAAHTYARRTVLDRVRTVLPIRPCYRRLCHDRCPRHRTY